MKNFSQLISESDKHESTKLLRSEITTFINKVKKNLPIDVQKAIYLTSKYDITSADEVDEIRTASKSKLKSLVDKFNMPLEELEDLWQLLKGIKQNYKVMPQYLSPSEREEVEKGMLALDDLTIDLSSNAGKNAVAKMYTPTVLKIAKQLKETTGTRLDLPSLISAGMEGLALAMQDWKREPDKKTGKVVSFKTYAGYRIQQRIKNEIDAQGHTLTGTNWYATAQARKEGTMAKLDAVSIDQSAIDAEHFNALAVDDKDHNDDPAWKTLFSALEKQFTQRDVDVFYRFFGVNGRKAEKSKDIAKSYGMSEGNIRNSIINKMLKFIKSKPVLMDMLRDILAMYTESLMTSMIGFNRDQIIEAFASDDTYILLEELTKWNTKDGFAKSYKYALGQFNASNQKVIKDALTGGFEVIDGTLRNNSKLYIEFLKYMDPVSSNKFTDGDVINAMVDISNHCKKYKL